MWMLLLNRKVQIAIVVIIIVTVIFFYGRNSASVNKPPKPKDLPNSGSGIPKGWSPSSSARKIHSSMSGIGTDTSLLFNTLDPLTDDQLAAVFNEFNRLYSNEGEGDLFQWFEDDLDSEELSRALGYFKFMR